MTKYTKRKNSKASKNVDDQLSFDELIEKCMEEMEDNGKGTDEDIEILEEFGY